MFLLQETYLPLDCLCHQCKFQPLGFHSSGKNGASKTKQRRRTRRRVQFINWQLFSEYQIFRPTFRRIIRTRSTEQFSGMPYVYALLNCLISSWYGTPLVSSDNLLVTTVNSVGAVFQLIYISLFISYAEKVKKVMCPYKLTYPFKKSFSLCI